MRCRQCSEVRGYPYKRSHLVALRATKITAKRSAVSLVAGRALNGGKFVMSGTRHY